jgi:formylglycine-generating enzyme required for sulfatase activity
MLTNVKLAIVACLWSVLMLATTALSAQQRDYYGRDFGRDICRSAAMTSTSDEEVNSLVGKIVEAYGLNSRFITRSCPSVDNCLAIVDENGKPYILYNPQFLSKVRALGFSPGRMPQSSVDWNVMHVLAHEVAHHLNNHLTNPPADKRLPDLELEADKAAGSILYRLGAPSLSVAQRVMDGPDVSEYATATHPSRAQRKAAFRAGWEEAAVKYPPTPSDTSPNPPNQYNMPIVRPVPAFPSVRPRPFTTTDPTAGTLVLVKGGSFTMGCTSEQQDCSDDEKPEHNVTLRDYYIGQKEVTQAQWQEVMGYNPSHFAGCEQCPVENVSWDDVQEFLLRLNEITGKRFRLPTEEEWEYAARGGQQLEGYIYAGGDDLKEVGWYVHNSRNRTSPVGQKAPNALELYDMSGNVWEWCENLFGAYSAWGQPSEDRLYRVFRGGAYRNAQQNCQVSKRGYDDQGDRHVSVGFRLAMSN